MKILKTIKNEDSSKPQNSSSKYYERKEKLDTYYCTNQSNHEKRNIMQIIQSSDYDGLKKTYKKNITMKQNSTNQMGKLFNRIRSESYESSQSDEIQQNNSSFSSLFGAKSNKQSFSQIQDDIYTNNQKFSQFNNNCAYQNKNSQEQNQSQYIINQDIISSNQQFYDEDSIDCNSYSDQNYKDLLINQSSNSQSILCQDDMRQSVSNHNDEKEQLQNYYKYQNQNNNNDLEISSTQYQSFEEQYINEQQRSETTYMNKTSFSQKTSSQKSSDQTQNNNNISMNESDSQDYSDEDGEYQDKTNNMSSNKEIQLIQKSQLQRKSTSRLNSNQNLNKVKTTSSLLGNNSCIDSNYSDYEEEFDDEQQNIKKSSSLQKGYEIKRSTNKIILQNLEEQNNQLDLSIPQKSRKQKNTQQKTSPKNQKYIKRKKCIKDDEYNNSENSISNEEEEYEFTKKSEKMNSNVKNKNNFQSSEQKRTTRSQNKTTGDNKQQELQSQNIYIRSQNQKTKITRSNKLLINDQSKDNQQQYSDEVKINQRMLARNIKRSNKKLILSDDDTDSNYKEENNTQKNVLSSIVESDDSEYENDKRKKICSSNKTRKQQNILNKKQNKLKNKQKMKLRNYIPESDESQGDDIIQQKQKNSKQEFNTLIQRLKQKDKNENILNDNPNIKNNNNDSTDDDYFEVNKKNIQQQSKNEVLLKKRPCQNDDEENQFEGKLINTIKNVGKKRNKQEQQKKIQLNDKQEQKIINEKQQTDVNYDSESNEIFTSFDYQPTQKQMDKNTLQIHEQSQLRINDQLGLDKQIEYDDTEFFNDCPQIVQNDNKIEVKHQNLKRNPQKNDIPNKKQVKLKKSQENIEIPNKKQVNQKECDTLDTYPLRKRSRLIKEVLQKQIESFQCTICLDNPSKSYFGEIDCFHKFCFSCIQSWSKVTNQCPICRKEFKQIIKKNFDGTETKYKPTLVRNKKQKVNEEYYIDEVQALQDEENLAVLIENDEMESSDVQDGEKQRGVCYQCLSSDKQGLLLICDVCDDNYCHTYCDEQINSNVVPEGRWACHQCRC